MTAYTAPGIQPVNKGNRVSNWENVPQYVKEMYQQETESLINAHLSAAETRAKEAEIYNRTFKDYGLRKPSSN